MDEVYENLLRQVAGDRLLHIKNESIKESINRSERRVKLEKEIAVLENKIKAEKQFNRQVELYERLGKLRGELL